MIPEILRGKMGDIFVFLRTLFCWFFLLIFTKNKKNAKNPCFLGFR